jgi:hypothetical protein
MWLFADLRFANLKLTQINISSPYKYSILYNAINQICTQKTFTKTTFSTVLRQSCAIFCRNSGGFAICELFIQICGFAIRRLANLRNLRICDSGMRVRIGEIAICGIQEKFVCLPLFFQRLQLIRYFDNRPQAKFNQGCYLTRFKTYKTASHPKQKPRRGGASYR